MKNKNLLPCLILPLALCSLFACGNNSEPKDLGNLDSTLGEAPYAKDTGTLLNHIFEMENAVFNGVSQSAKSDYGHQCSGVGYFIDSSLSNGVCIRNLSSVNSQNSFRWTFESDKAVTVDVDIRISAKYVSKSATWPESLLSAAYTIKNNDEVVDITDVKVPGSTAESKLQDNNYSNMVTSQIEMKLHQGVNNIDFLPTSAGLNIDYINIKTSANITNYTKHNWYDSNNILEIVTAPTLTAAGTIKVKCGHTGCTNPENTFTLPNLQNSAYIKEGDIYSITIADRVFNFTSATEGGAQ